LLFVVCNLLQPKEIFTGLLVKFTVDPRNNA
jgi:hypothetical protein